MESRCHVSTHAEGRDHEAALVAGVVTNEWVVSHVLTPGAPVMRPTSRLFLWSISLGLLGLGAWLIACRKSIRPANLLALGFSLVLLLMLFVGFDLARAYALLKKADGVQRNGGFVVKDETLGWALKPGANVRAIRAGEYDATYEIDEHGFRKTPGPAAPAFTIYVLGDSFAFGLGVKNDSTFSSRLVGTHLATNVCVRNLGVPGYGITQMYAMFLRLEPGLRRGDVVLFAPIAHDIVRNSKDFDFFARMLFWEYPVENVPVFENGVVSVERFDTLGNRVRALLNSAPWTGGLIRRVFKRSEPDTLGDAVQMMELARRATEARGAKFLLCFLPEFDESRHARYHRDLSRFNYEDLLVRLPRGSNELAQLFFPNDGHLTETGHRFVAGLLSRSLVDRGLVSREYLKTPPPSAD